MSPHVDQSAAIRFVWNSDFAKTIPEPIRRIGTILNAAPVVRQGNIIEEVRPSLHILTRVSLVDEKQIQWGLDLKTNQASAEYGIRFVE